MLSRIQSWPGILTVSFRRQIVLALFTVVWLVVDYREKEDKAPPPASSLPDSAKSDYAAKMTAYILAWIGESTEVAVLLLFQLTETVSPRQACLAGLCHACTASSTLTASVLER